MVFPFLQNFLHTSPKTAKENLSVENQVEKLSQNLRKKTQGRIDILNQIIVYLNTSFILLMISLDTKVTYAGYLRASIICRV